MLSSGCDVIDIIDDDENEQQEMFALTLSTSDPAVLFENAAADVFINNNDCELKFYFMCRSQCTVICFPSCFNFCSNHRVYRISIHSV